jgi:tetratricopeptide (TPR) repeat protein
VIAAIAGSAGISKTALAVHWAHRNVERFPDGQLYVNLRGYDPDGPAMTTAEALRGFLAALGVPPQRVPARVEAQAGLYRSLLAGREVLVVLDNARGAEQVRPLLLGTRGCLAVVTSRTQLSGLVAVDGAGPLNLDLLSTEDARELLAGRLGAARVAAEPVAQQIIDRCARLPLALAIVAARGATHPGFSLAALAEELAGDPTGLDAFSSEDTAVDVRAVFSWSYRQLSPAEARLFRLLGLHPGPDATAPAAASLAGLPLPEVRALLGALARAHLITEHMPGRYTQHDLLRHYAAELATRHDDSRFAVHRVLDHYLETAHAAATLIEPHGMPWEPVVRLPGVEPERLSTQQEALAWYAAERAVLLGCLRTAAAHGLDTHVWRIAAAAADFFDRQGHWHDWASSAQAALEAAIRLGDKAAQAHAHRNQARALAWLGDEREADVHLRYALDLYRALGDAAGRAHVHRTMCWLLGRQGAHDAALDHAEEALALYRVAGDRLGQGLGLNALGWQCAKVGDYWRASAASSLALELFTELADYNGAAHAFGQPGLRAPPAGRPARVERLLPAGARAVPADRGPVLRGRHADPPGGHAADRGGQRRRRNPVAAGGGNPRHAQPPGRRPGPRPAAGQVPAPEPAPALRAGARGAGGVHLRHDAHPGRAARGRAAGDREDLPGQGQGEVRPGGPAGADQARARRPGPGRSAAPRVPLSWDMISRSPPPYRLDSPAKPGRPREGSRRVPLEQENGSTPAETPLARRRVLRAAAIGAAATTAAFAGRAIGAAPAASADADESGQVTLGAVLLSFASAPLNARGSVTWTVTKQRTDTFRMNSSVLVGTNFSSDFSVKGQFVSVSGSSGISQAGSTQVTNALTVRSSQAWSISTFASSPDGYNTVDDTTFFLILQPVMGLTGNPVGGFRYKFLDGGIKSARRVAELRDPAFRASIGAATADAILAQYPLLQNVSGRALGLAKPRYKLKDQINPTLNPLAFDRTISTGSSFSEQKTSQLTVTITRSVGFTSPLGTQAFTAGAMVQITSTSVQEIDTTKIISTSGQLTGDRDHVNFIYVDRVFKTILITDEGPRSQFRPVLSGVVTDQFGGPVSGAIVSLVDSDGVYRTAVADSAGSYTIVRETLLSPGTYTVVCAGIQQFVNVGSSGTGSTSYSGVNPSSARLPTMPVVE